DLDDFWTSLGDILVSTDSEFQEPPMWSQSGGGREWMPLWRRRCRLAGSLLAVSRRVHLLLQPRLWSRIRIRSRRSALCVMEAVRSPGFSDFLSSNGRVGQRIDFHSEEELVYVGAAGLFDALKSRVTTVAVHGVSLLLVP